MHSEASHITHNIQPQLDAIKENESGSEKCEGINREINGDSPVMLEMTVAQLTF